MIIKESNENEVEGNALSRIITSGIINTEGSMILPAEICNVKTLNSGSAMENRSEANM